MGKSARKLSREGWPMDGFVHTNWWCVQHVSLLRAAYLRKWVRWEVSQAGQGTLQNVEHKFKKTTFIVQYMTVQCQEVPGIGRL
jgi:hypothetical protein